MCGIVGYFSSTKNRALQADLEQACCALVHRGPDAQGTYFDPDHGIGLAHQRLSIIDLTSQGAQPMSSEGGETVIVFNGEVYNFKKIRRSLEHRGYQFKGHSDTEVVLYAYQEWGVCCVEQFVGMFALAVWDGRRRQIFIARDRLGIKPIFYYFDQQTLIFASELKAIMAFSQFPRSIDQTAIPLFLHYQYVPAPRTIFLNTYKLEPGSTLVYDGRRLEKSSYWPGPDKCLSALDEDDALEELDRLLTQAVTDRLVSDVPLGALLSGGIDSSLVVALMQKANSSPVRTFSIGFEEKNYNEAPWAAAIAAHIGTDHTELYVDAAKALDVIPLLPVVYDEPFADSSAIPTLMVSQLTRQHVTVALSGDGGDEQFAGYVRYWMAHEMMDWTKRIPRRYSALMAKWLSRMPPHIVERIYRPLLPYLPQRFRVANFQDKWQKLPTLLDKQQLSDIYRMTVCLWSDNELPGLLGQNIAAGAYESVFEETRHLPTMSRLMRVDQHTYLPDCMLTKVDRASMHSSLEIRVPLLDHRVVEFTRQLPESLKYRNGSGKYLLKKLLSRYVPNHLFERPKMGFGVPMAEWIRGPLKGLVSDYLSAESLNKEGYFNSRVVEKKLQEHMDGTCYHHYRIWALLMWEMWREQWLS